MKLKQQITLLTSLALLIPAVLIGAIAIYEIKSKATADIEEYRQEEFAKLKLYLKHITDIAYGIIETKHKQSQEAAADTTGTTLSPEAWMDDCLHQLSQIRFDQGKGYFWVTDNHLPFPTMIMHAEKKNLTGVVLDDPKHNVEKGQGRNIYQVRAQLANDHGDAFVEYVMKKPGSDSVENKISYSRLYKPLGWIVSTGFYTDQIEATVEQKKAALGHQISTIVLLIVGVGVVILGTGLTVSIYFSNQLTNAIILIKEKLKELARGTQVDHLDTTRKDEVGDMTVSLNSLVDGLKSYTSFAREIGLGDLTREFTPLSSDDVLGNELIMMRNNLKKAEDEKNIRDWTNEGLARLSEVLRRNNNNIRSLGEEILRELVRYLKVNQGALFVVCEEPKDTLELVAAYAYEKKKFIDKKIGFGDGLVGQCVLEGSTIHLRQVPESYVHITSGLGEALPRTLLLVPLRHNDKVHGVVELASFKDFSDYQIAFIEKISESLASTISTTQVNENTQRLLEQSQQMGEELKAQEEEVRQNMEELSATQEQMSRQVEENRKMMGDLRTREEVIALTTLVSESDLYGNIALVNDKLCEVSGYSRSELIGQPHSLFRHPDMPKELFKICWDTIKSGKVFKAIMKNRAKEGSAYWQEATIVPVKDDTGKVHKYIGACYLIAEEDVAIQLYNRQAKRMNLPLLTEKPELAEAGGPSNGYTIGVSGPSF